MASLDAEKAYKAEVRVTGTRGFGDTSLLGSFSRGNPEELLSSLGADISNYRSSVHSLGQLRGGSKTSQELSSLRAAIQEKIEEADQEIKAKVARGESQIVTKKLTDQLQEQRKEFESLKEQENKKGMEGEGSVQESQADSFTSDPTVNNDGDTLAQEALQVDQSGLNIREQQATEIRELEKDIGDLHDISKHINVMIVDQGSQIDRIELHTEKAAHRTEKGTANTTTAVVLKRQNNTLLIALLVAGGGVLLFIIIVIIILAVVLTRNN